VAMKYRVTLLAIILILLLPHAAHAQAANMGQADAILRALQAASNGWNGPATRIGTDILGGLAVITFILSVGFATMTEGSVNPIAIGALLIRHTIYFGFWTWLLHGWGGTFGHAIIESFQTAAQQMGGPPMTPVATMQQGGDLAAGMWQQTSLLRPGAAVGLSLSAIAVFILFAITAALMLLSLGKAFVTVGIGALFMGFSGFPETKGLAMNAVFMTIGAGARLFMIELIAGLGANILKSMSGQNTVLGQDNIWGVLGLGIVMIILMFSLPSMAEHMGGGTGHARVGPGELMRTLQAAAATASSAAGAAAAVGGKLGSIGSSMMSMLPSSGGGSSSTGLPAPSISTGSNASVANAGSAASSSSGSGSSSGGSRMQPSNARFSRNP
jgi:type IV secretion system protein TrbL